MNTEKLLALADFLEDLPDSVNFSMKYWKKENECSTTCCAIGWAIEMGHLPELSLEKIEGKDFSRVKLDLNQTYCSEEEIISDFEAVAQVFDISYSEAEYLFCPFSYNINLIKHDKITMDKVIGRIRNFAAFGDSHEPPES